MSAMLASFGAILLSCSGTQSTGPLWSEESTQFQIVLEAGDFFGSDGPFEWNLDNREVARSNEGDLLLTATLREFPRARFSARLGSHDAGKALVWEVAEATSKDGQLTLQTKGKATCKAENKVSAA